MKGFTTIVIASALLSASLVAGLAASDQARPSKSGTNAAEPANAQRSGAATTVQAAPQAGSTAWVDPPARSGCRRSAWPYRSALCAASESRADARKVRVISTDSQNDGRSTMPAALALR